MSSLLVQGATLVSGDKVFSDFSYSPPPPSTCCFPTAEHITITPIEAGGEYGINIAGYFSSSFVPVTASLSYTVSVMDPSMFLIDGGRLSANPQSFLASTVTLLQTFSGGETNQVSLGAPGPVFTAFATPTASVQVTNQFTFIAQPMDVPSITSINETFSQARVPPGPPPVPEPAALTLLLGAAATGLGVVRRRRRGADRL